MIKIVLFSIIFVLSGMVCRAQEYVFFLHNRYLQEFDLQSVHPEYGRVEYQEILDVFRKQKFTVFSDIRPKGSSGDDYAQKVKRQIDSLLSKGVKPNHITVVGTSMGGYIAQYVSSLLKNKNIKYVFIGCCSDKDYLDPKSPTYYGSILSIYEKSDDIGRSCQMMKEKSGSSVVKYKEIELNTGLKHGFLYKALQVWLEPTIKWAKGED
ncbi:MAG: alpha/beta hydrolase [Ignavibacteriae bacterium]|nr:alpha/beta hydrolase [Ignavibacteriota bacterium]